MAHIGLNQRFGGALGRRLLFWALLISGVNALGGASVQIYLDYRRDVEDLSDNMLFIANGAVPAIAHAAWNFDRNQIEAQIAGIVNSLWVSGALVRYGPSESASVSIGKIETAGPDVRVYLLRHGGPESGGGVAVGRLFVQPNWSEVYRRTGDRALVILSTQVVKVSIFAVCLLWLVSWLIIGPLRRMAEFARGFAPGRPFEPLAPQGRRRDELGDLQQNLNDAYQRLHAAHVAEQRQIEELEERVAERTEALRAANAALAARELAMRELAYHDPLTGLANRKLLDERLAHALARAHRNGRHVVVLLIDLDDFKEINDRFGHAAGDALLQAVAGRMRGLLRETDTLARMGGDEFVAVLDDVDPAADVSRVAHDLAAAIAAPWEWEGATVHPSGSVGSARYPVDALAAFDLLRAADRRMYAAKRRSDGDDGPS